MHTFHRNLQIYLEVQEDKRNGFKLTLYARYWARLDQPEVSNLKPAGCMQPRVAVNAAQHKIINLLKTL